MPIDTKATTAAIDALKELFASVKDGKINPKDLVYGISDILGNWNFYALGGKLKEAEMQKELDKVLTKIIGDKQLKLNAQDLVNLFNQFHQASYISRSDGAWLVTLLTSAIKVLKESNPEQMATLRELELNLHRVHPKFYTVENLALSMQEIEGITEQLRDGNINQETRQFFTGLLKSALEVLEKDKTKNNEAISKHQQKTESTLAAENKPSKPIPLDPEQELKLVSDLLKNSIQDNVKDLNPQLEVFTYFFSTLEKYLRQKYLEAYSNLSEDQLNDEQNIDAWQQFYMENLTKLMDGLSINSTQMAEFAQYIFSSLETYEKKQSEEDRETSLQVIIDLHDMLRARIKSMGEYTDFNLLGVFKKIDDYLNGLAMPEQIKTTVAEELLNEYDQEQLSIEASMPKRVIVNDESNEFNAAFDKALSMISELEQAITKNNNTDIKKPEQSKLYHENLMTLLRSNSYESFIENSAKKPVNADETENKEQIAILQKFLAVKEYYGVLNRDPQHDANKAKAIVNEKTKINIDDIAPAEVERYLAILQLATGPAAVFGNFQVLLKEFLFHPGVTLGQSEYRDEWLEYFRAYMLDKNDGAVIQDLVENLFVGTPQQLEEIHHNIIADHDSIKYERDKRFELQKKMGFSIKTVYKAEALADSHLGQSFVQAIAKPEQSEQHAEHVTESTKLQEKSDKTFQDIKQRNQSAPAEFRKSLDNQLNKVFKAISAHKIVKAAKSAKAAIGKRLSSKYDPIPKMKPELTIKVLTENKPDVNAKKVAISLRNHAKEAKFIKQLKEKKLGIPVFDLIMKDPDAASLILSTTVKDKHNIRHYPYVELLTAEQLARVIAKYSNDKELINAITKGSANLDEYLLGLALQDRQAARVIFNNLLNKLDDLNRSALIEHTIQRALTEKDIDLAKSILIQEQESKIELDDTSRDQLTAGKYFSENIYTGQHDEKASIIQDANFFAERGSANAQYFLAKHYFNKYELDASNGSKEKWLDYLNKAVMQNYPSALLDMTICFAKGIVQLDMAVPKNQERFDDLKSRLHAVADSDPKFKAQIEKYDEILKLDIKASGNADKLIPRQG